MTELALFAMGAGLGSLLAVLAFGPRSAMVTKGAGTESAWSRHRFGATLLLATLFHGGLVFVDQRRSQDVVNAPRELLEVDVFDPEEPQPVEPQPVSTEHALRTAPALATSPGAPSAKVASATAEPSVSEAPPQVVPGVAPRIAEASPRLEPKKGRGVRLFLNARELNELTDASSPEPAPQSAPSVGLLREGLAAMDAEKGLSASSPQVSAGYRAAAHGPATGTAVFELRTDASGAVSAVNLVGAPGDGAWAAVAADLLRRLKQQRAVLPAGAKGMVTRIRIDRGALAEVLSERGKTKRGVALGQDHHAKDYGWNESTQASSQPGGMSPSLGVSSEMLNTSVKTRVTLLGQWPL